MGGLVPVGTPKEIIELLQAQFAKAMAAPDVKERLSCAWLRARGEHVGTICRAHERRVGDMEGGCARREP
jgi:hypothetical protein